MAGRKPKPTTLKLIQGNPGKRELNKREPQPVGNLTDAPDWMTESQKEGWDYAIANAPRGLLKHLDASLLASWVVAQDLHRDAAQKVAKYGMLVKTPNTGQMIQSPYMAVLNRQATLMMKAASELGFSPTSRSRIVLTEEAVGDDPWAKLAAEG